MIKYFHELKKEEYQWLIAEGTTWNEVEKDFPQPPWCKEYRAIAILGCWSLTGLMVTGEDYCKNCDSYCKKE